MNNKELFAARHLLMFTAPEAAAYIANGINEKSWRRWEVDTTNQVKEDIAAKLDAMLEARLQLIHENMNNNDYIFYRTFEEYAEAFPESPNVAAWRLSQSVAVGLFALGKALN